MWLTKKGNYNSLCHQVTCDSPYWFGKTLTEASRFISQGTGVVPTPNPFWVVGPLTDRGLPLVDQDAATVGNILSPHHAAPLAPSWARPPIKILREDAHLWETPSPFWVPTWVVPPLIFHQYILFTLCKHSFSAPFEMGGHKNVRNKIQIKYHPL
jgi:hypothetical protein